MRPKDWEEQKEIKIPAKLYEMLEEFARKEGKDTDTLIKYILLDALAPSVAEEGRKVGELAAELGKQIVEAFSKSKNESRDEPPDHIN